MANATRLTILIPFKNMVLAAVAPGALPMAAHWWSLIKTAPSAPGKGSLNISGGIVAGTLALGYRLLKCHNNL